MMKGKQRFKSFCYRWLVTSWLGVAINNRLLTIVAAGLFGGWFLYLDIFGDKDSWFQANFDLVKQLFIGEAALIDDRGVNDFAPRGKAHCIRLTVLLEIAIVVPLRWLTTPRLQSFAGCNVGGIEETDIRILMLVKPIFGELHENGH